MVFGALYGAIYLVVEIADGKEVNPRACVMRTTVYKHEWRDEFIVGLARDRIHHASSVLNREEPKIARHLFVDEKRARHMYHCFPMTFNQTI